MHQTHTPIPLTIAPLQAFFSDFKTHSPLKCVRGSALRGATVWSFHVPIDPALVRAVRANLMGLREI